MKLRIIRVNIKEKEGLKILKPNDKVIEKEELENYRNSLKADESDAVLFTYEELGEEI